MRRYTDPMVRAAVLELYLHADRDGLVRMSHRQFQQRLGVGSDRSVAIVRRILEGPVEQVRRGSGHRGTTYRVPVVHRRLSVPAAGTLTTSSVPAAGTVTEQISAAPPTGAPLTPVVHRPQAVADGRCGLCEFPVSNRRHISA